jgi:hypothetical protein
MVAEAGDDIVPAAEIIADGRKASDMMPGTRRQFFQTRFNVINRSIC